MQCKKNLMIKSMNCPMILQNLSDGLANILGPEAEDISDEGFVNKKELQDKVLENIKGEYGFEEINDAFDETSVPHQLEISMVVSMKTLFRHVTFCHLIITTEGLLLSLYLTKDKM